MSLEWKATPLSSKRCEGGRGKMAGEETILIVVGILGILAFLGLVGAYAARYKKVPPDAAMVVYGRGFGGKGYDVRRGGGKFIVPILESYRFLPLGIRTLDVVVNELVTDVARSGARVNVKAVAQVRIADDADVLRTAAGQLLHKSDQEINEIALKTLEGHVRGVCATLTIEQINSERDAMASKILTMAGEDLKNMGIEIRSFVIKEIEDEHGYLDALGIKRTEEVKRDARIGKANANREATIAEAIAAQQAEKANADAEAQVAQFHRDRDVIRFKAEGEVETERSNREISFQMQTARRNQELVAEQTKIDIRQKEQQVLVQQQEVLRRMQEQAAEQVVPAKAKADAVAAEADIIRLKGEANAYAIKATGLAEAEAMRAKAQSWEQYGKAAITQLIVEKLPEIVANAAKSLESTQKLIIMGDRGPSQLVSSVVDIAATAPALVKSLTGMDLTDLAGKLKDIVK